LIDKKKSRTPPPYPFPEPLPESWPQPGQAVDLLWAHLALQFGNLSLLARHLRENEEVDPSLRQSIERMSAPKRQGPRLKRCYYRCGKPAGGSPPLPSSPADLADLFDPPPGSNWWLKFVGRKGPNKSDHQARRHAIRVDVENELVVERKKTLAVKAVAKKRGLSCSTVWRCLKESR